MRQGSHRIQAQHGLPTSGFANWSVMMRHRDSRRKAILRLEHLETREAPSVSPISFDGMAVNSLPTGWNAWSSDPKIAFQVSTTHALSGSNGAMFTPGLSSAIAQAWLTTAQPNDVQVSAADFLTNLTPAQVFARGTNLGGSTATYYAVQVSRGLTVQLVKVVNGTLTSLASVKSVSWLDNHWVQETLNLNGKHLQVQLFRPDTAQYLTSAGQWQTAQAWVIDITDASITNGSQVGVARPGLASEPIYYDDFAVVGLAPTVATFESTPVGYLPAGWQGYSNNPTYTQFTTGTGKALSGSHDLQVTAQLSGDVARAWQVAAQPADIQVSAAVYVSNQTPAQVMARGSNLDTATPTYYAVQVTSGFTLKLVRVVNGVTTTLGQISSPDYLTNQWIQLTLDVEGRHVRAQVFRLDKGQYLVPFPSDPPAPPLIRWQTSASWALDLTDSAIAGGGLVGVGRTSGYSESMYFDDFFVAPPPGDTFVPVVSSVTTTPNTSALTGLVNVQATATDNFRISRVKFWVDNGSVPRYTAYTPAGYATPTTYTWNFDTSTASNGSHILTVKAYDLAGNMGQASINLTTQNVSALPEPTIPQHYSWIRLAELAYSGWTQGSFENQLLTNSVDLVVPDSRYLSSINAVAPNTPLLIYTSFSNIYQNLYTAWLNYADANGLDREKAFFHASTPISFNATSPSSQPVTWFWGVQRYTASSSTYTDLTAAASSSQNNESFGASVNDAVDVGYPDPFREINVNLVSAARGGWSDTLEYVSAVDANGNPTAWSRLNPISDTTNGLTNTTSIGRITFDPPADWKTASINGSARLYYVRFRTTATGTAPVSKTILGRDYVGANGGTSGVIPVFDSSADTNHDGYLSDTEYANRAPGKNARFYYESRVFDGNYGQMRFITDPAYAGFQNWVSDYNFGNLQNRPLASGFFVDNENAVLNTNPAGLLEQMDVANFASNTAILANVVGQRIATLSNGSNADWLLANTSGSVGQSADPVSQHIQGYLQEFNIRPLGDNYQTFESNANQVSRRAALSSPSPYAVIDSYSQGGSRTDARTQLATLAYYYLLADPASTFLMFYGGESPNTSWNQHWTGAVTYNIGQPTNSWSLFASGQDPSNSALTYHIYQRSFANGTTPALVLYKPLSAGNGTATIADNTATTHQLGGTYRQVLADGTLGPPITSITLRNGEGAILIKVP
jgi:hypothetical protein